MLRFKTVVALLLATSPGPFASRTRESGLTHVLRNEATAEKHLIETMTGGVAALDFDQDGRLDLYFVSGAAQPSLEKAGPQHWNRLYRGRGDGTFEDVTAKAGVSGAGYAMGVAAGDYDNDGFPDLFVAGVRRNQLFRNRGDGTFEEATVKAGLGPTAGQPWAVAGGWFDYDDDGDLDLFVVNYVGWDPAREPFCGDVVSRRYRTYCHPKEYGGLPNRLHRNNGNGTFTDVSAASGIAAHVGKGMGVAFADYDGDHRPDVFVANDTVPNFLFRNEGAGRFREVAAEAGVGLNDDGRALSSMGADFRDVDNDGQPDLFVTALANETFPLYRNLGKGQFADRTYPAGIGRTTLSYSGWGAGMIDLDNDGAKDLFAAGGDVQDNTELFSSRASRQPNVVLWNRKDGTFAGEALAWKALHRGAAFGDFNLDGRVDVAVSRLNETPVLLLNQVNKGHHWLGLRLRGTASNRDGLGAHVKLVTSRGTQWNQATTTVGYASSSSPMVHFGLGTETAVKALEVRWPSGVVQVVPVAAVDCYLTVEEPPARRAWNAPRSASPSR